MTNEIENGDTLYFFSVDDLYAVGANEDSIRKSTASKISDDAVLLPTESFGEQWFQKDHVYKTYEAAFTEASRILST